MIYEHLKGRPFVHGDTDCYGLIRDFYRDNFGIELTNYARPDNWWNEGLNLYMRYFREEGFRVVDDAEHNVKLLKPADLLLVTVWTEDPCHAGIYLGDGKILHHYFNRLSDVTDYGTFWRNSCCAVIRHKDVHFEEQKRTNRDIFDFILPHKREKLEKAIEEASE